MRGDKEKALALRFRGYSYNEIQKCLGIPKGTLSGWFSGLVLSEKAQNRLKKRVQDGSLKGLIKRNKLQTHKARQLARSIRYIATREINYLSQRELLLIGTALYWAEGYKKSIVKNGRELTSHTISFSNSDPVMIKLFLKFLKDILGIEEIKIHAHVRIFQHLNETTTFNYWHKVTGLPKENFYKFYYGISKSSGGKRPYNRLPYGTIQLVVGDTKKFHKIMGWIEGMQKQSLK